MLAAPTGLTKMTLVRVPRQQATVWLATQALDVPGDFIEAGVFRGGTAILMVAVLTCANDTEKTMWLADSFEGLPDPSWNPGDQQATGGKQADWKGLSRKWTASEAVVGESFARAERKWAELLAEAPEGTKGASSSTTGAIAKGGRAKRFGAWDEKRTRTLPGWFKDTLPDPRGMGALSFIRCDADMYSSTKECLDHLYWRLSPGGFVYIDDYWEFEACKRAVDLFRSEQRISEPLYTIVEDGAWHFEKDMSAAAVAAHKTRAYPRGTLERHIDAVFWKKGK